MKGIKIQFVSNDILAAGLYLLYIAGILWASSAKQLSSRIISASAAFLILALGMIMRHNALPAIIILSVWGLYRMKLQPLHSLILAVLFSAVAFIGNSFLTYHVLNAEASYPLKSPMADDLVNLSIVKGEWSDYCIAQGANTLPPPHEYVMLSPHVGNNSSPIAPYYIPEDKQLREQIYLDMRVAWWEEVSAHPWDYVAFKAFFYHQHLMSGRCIPAVSKLFRSVYPHVRIHMEKQSEHILAWLNREFLVLSIIPLTSYALLIVVPIWLRLKKKNFFTTLSPEMKDALFFILASMVYCATFIPFVLSATELRYYAIRAALCSVALPLFLISLWCKKNRV